MRHRSNHLLPQQMRGKEQDSIEEIMKGEENFEHRDKKKL
jgi:hypothetical protein